MQEAIEAEVGEPKVHMIDAAAFAHGLVGDTIGANLFLLGYAYQLGLIPVSAAALHEAIALNKVAVAFNQQTFEWGRRTAADREAVRALAGIAAQRWQPLQSVDAIIADRSARLAAYQDQRYAERYRAMVAKVRAAETALTGAGDEPPLTVAVARSLYKLMAYKDEYEVARLYSDPAFRHDLAAQFDGDYHLRFHLSPPLLARPDPDSGRPRKYAVPGWIEAVFPVLARMKRLRGTVFDPFGYSAERRSERAAVGDYEKLLTRLLAGLGRHNLALAVELAGLPQQVRGFGPVKARQAALAREREQELLARFEAHPPVDAPILYRAA
jgi:indolepyruvate ferredoxin oxidoreductase